MVDTDPSVKAPNQCLFYAKKIEHKSYEQLTKLTIK